MTVKDAQDRYRRSCRRLAYFQANRAPALLLDKERHINRRLLVGLLFAQAKRELDQRKP